MAVGRGEGEREIPNWMSIKYECDAADDPNIPWIWTDALLAVSNLSRAMMIIIKRNVAAADHDHWHLPLLLRHLLRPFSSKWDPNLHFIGGSMHPMIKGCRKMHDGPGHQLIIYMTIGGSASAHFNLQVCCEISLPGLLNFDHPQLYI